MILAIAIADWVAKLTGGFWEQAATGAPNEPTLAVTNDGDGDAVTATVDGDSGATNQLLYRTSGDATWTEGESRSGDGSIAQTGLDDDTLYEFIVVSQLGDYNSYPSNRVLVLVTSSADGTLEAAIYHQMADNTTGAIVGTRIYRAAEVPQGTLEHAQDFVVYQRIGTPRERYQGGPAGLAHARIQFSCYSATPKGAKSLTDAVRADWESQSGATGNAGATVTVKVATIEDERHMPQMPSDASQRVIHRYDLDILIWYLE